MGNGTRLWQARLARLAAARYARAGGGGLLAAAAVGQVVAVTLTTRAGAPATAEGAAVQAAVQQDGFPSALAVAHLLALGLLALVATVPLAVFRPAMATLTVTFGNAVALASFGQVTAAGVAAELIAACWLGLSGARGRAGRADMPGRYLAVGLALPFLVIALARGGWVAVFLAAAVPVAAGLGILAWAARLARTRTVAGEALADTLLAHTALGERARIARELHDVVAHHISMIAVLAETGRLTTPGLPEAGTRRFAEIGDTARAGLTEMRRLLGVLREDAPSAEDAAGSADAGLAGPGAPYGLAGAPGAGAAPGAGQASGTARRASRQPQPGLGQLTGLIDAARDASEAGARLIISGPVAPLDPGVELAAYRIVQEALTNVRRHAPGAAVDVELRYSAESLRLRVRDNGPGPAGPTGDIVADAAGGGGAAHEAAEVAAGSQAADGTGQPAGGGHGLAGMRERAFSVGGSLYAGLAAGGGFLIEAVLPADQDRAEAARAVAGIGGMPTGTGDRPAEANDRPAGAGGLPAGAGGLPTGAGGLPTGAGGLPTGAGR